MKGEKAVRVVETPLALTVAALQLAAVPEGVGADELVADARRCVAASNKMVKSRLELEKRLVNSKPLSVWTHSTVMPLRRNYSTALIRKLAEE